MILISCNSGPDSHTVTFNLDGGRFPNGYETTVAIADGGTLSDIPEPVKDSTSSYRYTFDGWYTDESLKNEYDVTLPVTGDLTIYAKWNRYSISHTKTYTVTFTIDDEVVATQTVKEGELATEPEGLGKKDDTNPSYSIVHYVTEWKREGEASAFTFDTPITEDIILVGTYDSTAPSGYEVNDAAGLRAWAEAIKSNNALACVLLDDIVLEGGPGNWTPVDFGGMFDGQEHKISNVNINTSSAEEHSGFFAELTSGAIVKDVTIEGEINSNGGSTVYAGGIAGLNSGNIEDSCFSGDVGVGTAYGFIGGIAGKNVGSIKGCGFSGTINGITDATATYTSSTAGGIAGENGGDITDCEFSGNISGMTDTAIASSGNVGGVAGKNTGSIIGCSSSGSVSDGTAASGNSGGIVGLNEGSIIGCDSSSEIDGDYAGGISGTNEGSIIACYSSKTVNGGNNAAGGIVGSNGPTGADSSVIACYSTATVSGKSKAGSIIGLNHATGTVSSCYWSGDSGNGVGTDNSSSAETHKVENGDWSSAMAAMNSAIDIWNESNGDACPYGYTATGASPSDGIPLILR